MIKSPHIEFFFIDLKVYLFVSPTLEVFEANLIMENLLSILPVLATDLSLTDFTFWIGFAAMFAATLFFFSAMNLVADKWKTSMLVSALITAIAALHYYYMRNAAMEGDITTAYRYVDWILTVPLMCVEFYLILKPSGATKSLLWKLIALSVIMLVTGYFGEAGIMGLDAQLWGLASGIAYFWILYEVAMGGAAKLAKSAGGNVESAHKMLVKFVFIGWAIYPIGYMAGTDGWYSGCLLYTSPSPRDATLSRMPSSA